MKPLIILLILFSLTSCIPLSIAPKIENDKIKIARKFKKGLPNQYAFIFKDLKNADEFYYFINAKFDLDFKDVESNVPFVITGKEYGLTFFEMEKSTKTINLIPLLIDTARDNKEKEPMFQDSYASRKGHWYLILTVLDNEMKDCLSPKYKNRDAVVKYLRDLREEYLTTNDYRVAMLRNKLIKH